VLPRSFGPLACAGIVTLTGCVSFGLSGQAEILQFYAPEGAEDNDGDGQVDDAGWPAVQASRWQSVDESTPILAGTQLCVSADVSWPRPVGAPELWWPDCWTLAADAGIEQAEISGGTCWTLPAGRPGWTLTPIGGSPWTQAELSPDRLELDVLAASEVRLVLNAWPEIGAQNFLVTPTGDAWPAGFADPLPDPALIWPDRPVRLELGIVDAAGRLLAWTPELGEISVDSVEGPAPTVVSLPTGDSAGDPIELHLGKGARARFLLDIGGEILASREFVGADPGEASSIVIEAAMREEGEGIVPAAARALVRTADGERIYGAPVRWTHDGPPMILQSRSGGPGGSPEFMGLDYVAFEDDCQRPEESAGPREAVLKASLSGLRAELALSWTHPGGDSDTSWLPSGRCVQAGGCVCDAGGQSNDAGRRAGALSGLAGLLLGVRRRRARGLLGR
jgi:hypothetical protein